MPEELSAARHFSRGRFLIVANGANLARGISSHKRVWRNIFGDN